MGATPILTPSAADVPAGFARVAGTTLLVPSSEQSRETWPESDWRAIDRASKVLAARGVRLALMCEVCRTPVRQERSPGHMTLTCGHAVRECTGTIR